MIEVFYRFIYVDLIDKVQSCKLSDCMYVKAYILDLFNKTFERNNVRFVVLFPDVFAVYSGGDLLGYVTFKEVKR